MNGARMNGGTTSGGAHIEPTSRSSPAPPASPRPAATLLDSQTLDSSHPRPAPSANAAVTSAVGSLHARQFHPDASLVLVGIRASGKRSLGFIAATALGRRFVTEDHYFQRVNGLSRQDYLKAHGREQFHKQDVEISKRMLEDHQHHCVIDCGLGSLTRGLQDHLRRYSQTHPVVFVLRDMDHIKALLNLDDRSTKLLDTGNSTHRKCSSYEFFNLEDDSSAVTAANSVDADPADRASPNYSFKLRDAQADFSAFVRFITGAKSAQPDLHSPFSLDVPIALRRYTHALVVRLSDFIDGRIDFHALESAGDALEICVDQWTSSTAKALSRMVAVARRQLRVPILLSASSTLTAATTVDSAAAALHHGLRLGVEFISVDLGFEDGRIHRLIAEKGATQVIGTYSSPAPPSPSSPWRDTVWTDMYRRAVSLRCDMVRLLNRATSPQDNQSLVWFVEELKAQPGPVVPLIAINMGPVGRTSQLMNPILTPVTHPSLPTAPPVTHPPVAGVEPPDRADVRPLLSSRSIMSALFDSFVFDALKFMIVGANVSGSLSPAMHNAAYAFLGLKHHYTTRTITSSSAILELGRDDAVGGLSVVQPFKVTIVPELQSLSDHAQAIGAVNTLVALRATSDGAIPPLDVQARERNRAGRIVGWFGENTDFLGILTCVNRSLSPRNAIHSKTTGLVVGAGGMARAAIYALLQLGCKAIFVYNRTMANAHAIARHFNDWAAVTSGASSSSTTTPMPPPVRVLDSLDVPWPSGCAPPTMVVSCVTHELLDGNPGADFQMPEAWMQSATGGVVLEMAYMSQETPLLTQMRLFRERTKRPWVLVDGIETLIEQAMAQFETMTGRKAPRKCMADAVQQVLAAKENPSSGADGQEGAG